MESIAGEEGPLGDTVGAPTSNSTEHIPMVEPETTRMDEKERQQKAAEELEKVQNTTKENVERILF